MSTDNTPPYITVQEGTVMEDDAERPQARTLHLYAVTYHHAGRDEFAVFVAQGSSYFEVEERAKEGIEQRLGLGWQLYLVNYLDSRALLAEKFVHVLTW